MSRSPDTEESHLSQIVAAIIASGPVGIVSNVLAETYTWRASGRVHDAIQRDHPITSEPEPGTNFVRYRYVPGLAKRIPYRGAARVKTWPDGTVTVEGFSDSSVTDQDERDLLVEYLEEAMRGWPEWLELRTGTDPGVIEFLDYLSANTSRSA